jgi:cupin 2 domain-containing protein
MNLLRDLPDARTTEISEMLATGTAVRVERITSLGQATPDGCWYDQDEAEFVIVLAGAARLHFADEAEPRHLGPGDCIDIAPHRRHRVAWTDPDRPTVWLAVFYR